MWTRVEVRMSINSSRLAVSNGYSATNYLPAVLKTNQSGWLIEYYVENPQTQQLARKKIKLQRLICRYSSKPYIKFFRLDRHFFWQFVPDNFLVIYLYKSRNVIFVISLNNFYDIHTGCQPVYRYFNGVITARQIVKFHPLEKVGILFQVNIEGSCSRIGIYCTIIESACTLFYGFPDFDAFSF